VSELPCFKCGRNVPPKRATHTRDGKIACPGCTKELGIRIEAREGYVEVTRMRTREQIEAEQERARSKAELAELNNEREEADNQQRVVAALDWVLGENDTRPSEEKQDDETQTEDR
jgi:uncharacterized Zn finger protein (UPF0148 family)